MSNKKKGSYREKQTFMSGVRQKWCAVFTTIGLFIMVATSYGWIKNPEPFLHFFLSVGVTFILGISATAVVNSWKTEHSSENANNPKNSNDRFNNRFDDRLEDRNDDERPYSQRAR